MEINLFVTHSINLKKLININETLNSLLPWCGPKIILITQQQMAVEEGLRNYQPRLIVCNTYNILVIISVYIYVYS